MILVVGAAMSGVDASVLGTEGRAPARRAWASPKQDRVVLLIALLMAGICALALPGFASFDNLALLLRNVAVLGVLATGLALVMISGGLDLSIVATATVSTATTLLVASGRGLLAGVAAGLGVALAMGVLNAALITLFEVPAFFATLGTGIALFGVARSTFVKDATVYIPTAAEPLIVLGRGTVLGVPLPVVVFLTGLMVAQLFLSRLAIGRFFYAHGDNPRAAQVTGIATRRLILAAYSMSAVIGFLAGLLLAGGARQLDTQVAASTLVYNVLLVVVVGGVSLVGGRGSMLGVLAGTLLLGVLVNVMTLTNLGTSAQNIFTGVVLFAALVLDNRLHPRDEETARQGE
jgi:ribose transport system permease protein